MSQYLRPAEVAARWACSPAHVRTLAARGELRGMKIGAKDWRFSLEAVLDFEGRNTPEATASAPAQEATNQEVSRPTAIDGFALPADYVPVFPNLWSADATKKAALRSN